MDDLQKSRFLLLYFGTKKEAITASFIYIKINGNYLQPASHKGFTGIRVACQFLSSCCYFSSLLKHGSKH